jgi:hypothetical protein
MDSPEAVLPVFERYGLEQLPRYHDPDRLLYQGLNVSRTSFRHLIRLGLSRHGRDSLSTHGGALPGADPLQLPGAFVIEDGRVIAGQSVLAPDDHPDFLALLIQAEALA